MIRGWKAGGTLIAFVALVALSGCTTNSNGPGGPLLNTHIELTAQVGNGGTIESPVPATKTVTLHGANAYLTVDLDTFPGVDWSENGNEGLEVLQDLGPMGHSTPAPCTTVTDVCQTTWSERYQAFALGTTTLTWTLFASAGGASASPTISPCPAGSVVASTPPPQADDGCVVGRVTVIVTVKQ